MINRQRRGLARDARRKCEDFGRRPALHASPEVAIAAQLIAPAARGALSIPSAPQRRCCDTQT